MPSGLESRGAKRKDKGITRVCGSVFTQKRGSDEDLWRVSVRAMVMKVAFLERG